MSDWYKREVMEEKERDLAVAEITTAVIIGTFALLLLVASL